MALFDIFRSSSYSHVIVTMGISCMVFPERKRDFGRKTSYTLLPSNPQVVGKTVATIFALSSSQLRQITFLSGGANRFCNTSSLLTAQMCHRQMDRQVEKCSR